MSFYYSSNNFSYIFFFCNLSCFFITTFQKLFLHFNFSDVKFFLHKFISVLSDISFSSSLFFFYHSFKSSIAQNNKLAEVRSAITNKMEEITKDIEVKLSTAEQNREKEIQKKLDFVKKEVRHTCYGSQRLNTNGMFQKYF